MPPPLFAQVFLLEGGKTQRFRTSVFLTLLAFLPGVAYAIALVLMSPDTCTASQSKRQR